MNRLIQSAAIVVGLVAALGAEAGPFTISSVVGGAPVAGAILDNLDGLLLGGPSSQTTATGVAVALHGGAAAVQGSVAGRYSAPFLSGTNGNGFGAGGTTQASGADTTTYVTSGATSADAASAVRLQLPGLDRYFGLLWGSVDHYNTLSFYNGATLVGSITGDDVSTRATGSVRADGTTYVNIYSTIAFDTVVATSAGFGFELDDIAYGPTSVPEPVTLGLIGTGLIGLAALRGRPRPPGA